MSKNIQASTIYYYIIYIIEIITHNWKNIIDEVWLMKAFILTKEFFWFTIDISTLIVNLWRF